MNATCPNCGKVLKVKDEWAGKTLKCPQCQKAFKAGAGAAISPAQAVAQLGKPKPAATKSAGPPVRQARAEQKAGLAVNWGPIVAIAGVLLLVLGIVIFVMGPMRVKGQFDAIHQDAEDNVSAVIEYALKCQASQAGVWNPRKGTSVSPSVNDINFHPDFFVMSMPPTVHFVGTTSNGKFDGDYTYATHEVVGTLTIGGVTLGGVHIDSEGVTLPGGQTEKRQSGLPMKGSGNVNYRLTGRSNEKSTTCELDGRKMDIYTPPELDEDGNPVDAPADATKKLDAARKSAAPFHR